MEERFEISILIDIYGNLLTDKQKDIMTLYYNEDLSLAEIAELNSTSRQAIHDIIKRCHKVLLDYEEKLGLMKRGKDVEKIKEQILNRIDFLKGKLHDTSVKDMILEIEKEIIDNI